MVFVLLKSFWSQIEWNAVQLNLVQVIIKSLSPIRAHPMWWRKNKEKRKIYWKKSYFSHTHTHHSPHSYVHIPILHTHAQMYTVNSVPNANPNPNQIQTDLLRKSNQITHKGILTSLFLQSTNPIHVIGTCIVFWCVNILYRRSIDCCCWNSIARL